MLPRRRQGNGTEEEGMNARHVISPYRIMLNRVSQHLTLCDCRRIGMIIGLTPAEDDTIQNSVDLLRMMEQRNEVSERNVLYLREILTEIKRDAAVDYVRQYEETLSHEDSNHSPETEQCVRDQRRGLPAAMKSFSTCIEVSLKERVRHRIGVSLFERISTDEIFYSRRRFLKVVLKSLCQQNIFLDYVSFINDHNSFITQWILSYIANQCSKKEVDIEQIALREIDWLLSSTEHSLEEAITEVTEEKFSFHQWLKAFSESFERNVRSELSEKAITDLHEDIHVSDYGLFTNECRNIIRDMKTSLLESISLPDTSDYLKVKEWLGSLPVKIHEELAKLVQGCGERCPICKTFCEDTIKEHNVHFSSLHFPRGIAGAVSKERGRLVTDMCSENVDSDSSYCKRCCGFDAKCDHSTMALFKDYESDFPHWKIYPSDILSEPYWLWVFTTFNKDFADYYGAEPAKIPWGWDMYSKAEALHSIEGNF